MKKLFILIITIFTITNLFSQEQTWWQNRKDKVGFPIYADVDLGLNLGGRNLSWYASAGLALTEHTALGLEYTYASFGSQHRNHDLKGIGVQGRYARSRFLGKFTAGYVYDFYVNDMDLGFNILSNHAFYYKANIAYRFAYICSIGLAYTRTFPIEYRLYDYFDNVDLGIRNSTFNHFALTISIHPFPPYSSKRK